MEDGRPSLQMPKGPCCSSPVGAAKGSRQHPSLPLQARLALLDHMAHVRAAYMPAWTYCRAFSCGLHLQLFRFLSKWARVTHPHEEYVASQIQRSPLSVVSRGMCMCLYLFHCRRGQMQKLIFHLRRTISTCPVPLDP